VNVSSLLLVRSEKPSRGDRPSHGGGRLYRQTDPPICDGGADAGVHRKRNGVSVSYAAMHLLTRLIPANLLVNMPYLEAWMERAGGVVRGGDGIDDSGAVFADAKPSLPDLQDADGADGRQPECGRYGVAHLGANLVGGAVPGDGSIDVGRAACKVCAAAPAGSSEPSPGTAPPH